MPPRSPLPPRMFSWLAIVEITGLEVVSSNSAEFASARPTIFLAASITMHCRPRQSPSVGILFSRAYLSAPTFPLIPRTPNPPGTQIASTSLKLLAEPASVSHSSLATHLIFTRALFANPPARSASVTDK